MSLKSYAMQIAICLAAASVCAATAQNQQMSEDGGGKKPTPISRSPHPTTEFDTTVLKEYPPMRLLPQYTGKNVKFVNAMSYPNFKFGTCYTVRQLLKEPQAQVLDWYSGALQTTGWKVNSQQSNQNTLVAQHTRELASCTLMMQPTAAPGYKTEITIKYQESSRR